MGKVKDAKSKAKHVVDPLAKIKDAGITKSSLKSKHVTNGSAKVASNGKSKSKPKQKPKGV